MSNCHVNAVIWLVLTHGQSDLGSFDKYSMFGPAGLTVIICYNSICCYSHPIIIVYDHFT